MYRNFTRSHSVSNACSSQETICYYMHVKTQQQSFDDYGLPAPDMYIIGNYVTNI